MCALNERVTPIIDQRSLLLRWPTPENKNPMPRGSADQADEIISELLPASSSVGVCVMCTHREDGVEEEHSLRSPGVKIPV